jgi:hypothetical protein
LQSISKSELEVKRLYDNVSQPSIKAKIVNTPQLQWWILAQGDAITVLQPESLCNITKEILKKTIQRYR